MITDEKQKVVIQTERFIREFFSNESSGHDWWHIFRVREMAVKIAKIEGGNLFQIEMAALLHDLDDWKLNFEKEKIKTEEWLARFSLNHADVSEILLIISQVSFKGAGVKTSATTLESQIVQDADRLDAMGAIGIARAFAYGGHKGRLIYEPEKEPVFHADFETYKKGNAPSINHFYEKLLLLKNRMNTETAKQMAKQRHEFMEDYLKQFFDEWENKI